MEVDAEIHSQALGLALESPVEERVDEFYEQGGVLLNIMMVKPTDTADPSLWELTDSRQTDREPAWD